VCTTRGMAQSCPLALASFSQLLLATVEVSDFLEGGDAFSEQRFSDVEFGGQSDDQDVLLGALGRVGDAFKLFLHRSGYANAHQHHLFWFAFYGQRVCLERSSGHRTATVIGENWPTSLLYRCANCYVVMASESRRCWL
jgi:hypothetical protein